MGRSGRNRSIALTQFKSHKLLYFFLGYAAYSIIYVSRLNFSVAVVFLKQLGILTPAQYGVVSGLFLITYSIGRLLNGRLGDWLPAPFMISTGLIITGACNLFIGALPTYLSLFFFWSINGYGQSLLWGPLLRIVSMQFTVKRKNFVASLLSSSVSFGSVAGIALATYASSHINVQYAFVIPGILALLAAAVISLFFKHPSSDPQEFQVSIRDIFRNSDLRFMLIPAFMQGILINNIGIWAPLFFVVTFNLDFDKLPYFVLIIPLAGLAGRLAYPLFLSVMKGIESRVVILGFMLCLIAAGLLLILHTPVPTAACLCLISGAISLVNTSFLSVYPLRYEPMGCVSSVAGILDFFSYLGAGLSAILSGFLVTRMGYKALFGLWAMVSVLAIALLFIKNKRKVTYARTPCRYPEEELLEKM